MKPTLLVAVLADAVTVRDGLLHLLGGGITTLMRPQFPAPIGARLALTVYFQFPTGHRDTITFGALCRSSSGETMFEIEGGIDVESTDGDVISSASIAVPLENAGVPSPGNYSIEVTINGEVQATVPFRAQLVDPGMMYPFGAMPFG